jgi:hypothetical protein
MEGRQKMSRSFPERFTPPSDELGLNKAWHTRRDVKVPCDTIKELVLQHLEEHVIIVSPSHGVTETMAEQLRSRGFVSKDGDKKCFKQHSCDEQGTVPEAGMHLDTGVFYRVLGRPLPFVVLLDPFDTETFVILYSEGYKPDSFGDTHLRSNCFQFHIKRDKDWKGAEDYSSLLGTKLMGGVSFPGTSNFNKVYFSAGLLLHVVDADDTDESSMMVHSIPYSESCPMCVKGHWTVRRSWLLFTDHCKYDSSCKLYCLNLWSAVHGVAPVHPLGEVSDRVHDVDLSAFSERKKIASASLEWE